MSRKKRLIGLLYMTVLCSQGLCARSRQMGIEELFRLADEQSRSIQTYRTGTEAADEALKAALAERLPDVSVSLSASYLGNGRIWDRGFGNAMTAYIPHFGNNFALEAQQVIYAGGAINSGIKLAELGKLLAVLDLQKNIQEIRFLLAGLYLDLYKLDNQILVLQKNMGLTEEVIAGMEARREQGTVLKNDITRYELQKEQLNLQLSRVKDTRNIANRRLTTVLHLPDSTELAPDASFLEQQILSLTEEEWLDLAKTNNILLKQAQASILMNKQNRCRNKIQPFFSVQERQKGEAGASGCQASARTLRIDAGTGRECRAGSVCGLSDSLYRSAYTGEQRKAGGRKLLHYRQPL